ncbi:TonB-dependent receptor plug domain-containing protein [Chondromyces crocatus]|uniref:TonB-dependent receptor n=1 Tax=Chondromyces crocatus TaxID=52 RepID=A0A0K1EMH2_CHOCO|nr:TonB-dependent receptor [Chondromyces crocatus]AKT42021.1 TonB-dependent receptor [Chondromyces crocatus]
MARLPARLHQAMAGALTLALTTPLAFAQPSSPRTTAPSPPPKSPPARPADASARPADASPASDTSPAPGDAPEGAPSEAHSKGRQPAAPEPFEVVVTGTRTPESSQRATVYTQVITRTEAERRGATNVGEALSQQLGVQVNPSAYGSLGSPSAIQIQGFDRDRVLVLEDGERVIGDTGGAIDLSQLPLTDVSRIELVTGPTSSLYGTAAIGGVINVISGPPAQFGPSGRVRLEGRNRWGLLAQGTGAYRRDDHWVSADASVQREDGLALDPNKPDMWLPNRMQTLMGLRAGAPLGSRSQLRMRLRWLRDGQDTLESQIVPGLSPFLIDVFETTQRVVVNASELIDLGGGSNLRLAVNRQWAGRTRNRDRRDSPVDELRELSGTMQSFEATATIAEGPRTWVVGVRGEVEQLEQEITRAEATPDGVTTRKLEEVPPTKLGNGAAYAQLGWKIGDTLTILPGVRGEAHLRYGGVVAPRLAIAYRPTSRLGLRLSGGRGFRAPSGKEIGFSFDHSYLGYRVMGNPDLLPEASWGVNGDATVDVTREIQMRVGGFANWVDNLIDIDVQVPLSSSGGVDTYAYRNISKARTAGLDVRATAKVGTLNAEVGYAYLWTRDDTHERPLESRPPHTVMAALRAELPWKLEVVLRYRMVSDAFLDQGLRTVPFQTLDARLARPLWSGAQAYVGTRNALGAQRDVLRIGDQRPMEGRIVYGGLIAELPWESEGP